MNRFEGYRSKNKTEALRYIARNATEDYVRSQAEKALEGDASYDSALVRAHKSGQDRIRETANAALGIND